MADTTLTEINNKIDAMIRSCDKIALPLVCKKANTIQGFVYVKSRIVHMVTKDDLSFSAAFAQLEDELNWN